MANEFRFEDHPDAAKFRPIADAEINDFAAKLGLEFSDEYLAFLKRHNGFDFDRLNEAAPLGPGMETFDDIGYLFGIDTGFEYNDLRFTSRCPVLGSPQSAPFPIRSPRGRVATRPFRSSRVRQKGKSTSSTTRHSPMLENWNAKASMLPASIRCCHSWSTCRAASSRLPDLFRISSINLSFMIMETSMLASDVRWHRQSQRDLCEPVR